MSNRNTTFSKRQRETSKKEKAKEKAQEKEVKRAERRARGDKPEGEEDPDIAGIVPGPQPPQE